MHDTMRQSIRMILLSLFLVSTGALAEELSLVTVSGSAELMVEPDLAVLGVGVEARAPTIEAARSEVNATVARVLGLTRKMNIPDQQVASAALVVQPDYQWLPETREQKLLGYLVARRLSIRLTDLSLLGEVYEGMLGLGINQVQPPTFDSSQRASLERQALADAAKDARSRAVVLAQALEMELGSAHRIEELGSQGPQPMREMVMAAAKSDDAQSYQVGQIRISSQVRASFELQQP
ncbi:MAG: SIMPL domain-containing protein [Gammaproteobacteria bacterium]